MDAQALRDAMWSAITIDRAAQLVGGANEALRLIGADTQHLLRAQHFLSQIGHESVSLRYTEEIASGSAYEGRADLGNTQPGDGVRFKGRSFIQITGRHNYTTFSQWAYGQQLVPSAGYFVEHPGELSNDRWAWVGSTWYWLTQRPLNTLADANDMYGVTRAINGGLNGLEDRINRFNHIRTLGTRILPGPGAGGDQEEEDMARLVRRSSGKVYLATGDSLTEMTGDELRVVTKVGLVKDPVNVSDGEFALLLAVARRARPEVA